MAADDAGLPAAAGVFERLLDDPAATQWARACGWVPGTGHCRERGCSARCAFRTQREAEARRVMRWRRLRRIFAQPRLR